MSQRATANGRTSASPSLASRGSGTSRHWTVPGLVHVSWLMAVVSRTSYAVANEFLTTPRRRSIPALMPSGRNLWLRRCSALSRNGSDEQAGLGAVEPRSKRGNNAQHEAAGFFPERHGSAVRLACHLELY